MIYHPIHPATSTLSLPQLTSSSGTILKGWGVSGPHPGSTAFIEKALVSQVSDTLLTGMALD